MVIICLCFLSDTFAVNSCLILACSADMCHITTVEGVGNAHSLLHPIPGSLNGMDHSKVKKLNGEMSDTEHSVLKP